MAKAEQVYNPTWGYRASEAKIFDDGVLPKGWFDSPAKIPAEPEVPSDPLKTEVVQKDEKPE